MKAETSINHTPGPWAELECGAIYARDPRPGHNGQDIKTAQTLPADEEPANARLIAAAPDYEANSGNVWQLLTLLKLRTGPCQRWADAETHAMATDALASHEAAMAKAETTHAH